MCRPRSDRQQIEERLKDNLQQYIGTINNNETRLAILTTIDQMKIDFDYQLPKYKIGVESTSDGQFIISLVVSPANTE